MKLSRHELNAMAERFAGGTVVSTRIIPRDPRRCTLRGCRPPHNPNDDGPPPTSENPQTHCCGETGLATLLRSALALIQTPAASRSSKAISSPIPPAALPVAADCSLSMAAVSGGKMKDEIHAKILQWAIRRADNQGEPSGQKAWPAQGSTLKR